MSCAIDACLAREGRTPSAGNPAGLGGRAGCALEGGVVDVALPHTRLQERRHLWTMRLLLNEGAAIPWVCEPAWLYELLAERVRALVQGAARIQGDSPRVWLLAAGRAGHAALQRLSEGWPAHRRSAASRSSASVTPIRADQPRDRVRSQASGVSLRPLSLSKDAHGTVGESESLYNMQAKAQLRRSVQRQFTCQPGGSKSLPASGAETAPVSPRRVHVFKSLIMRHVSSLPRSIIKHFRFSALASGFAFAFCWCRLGR